MLDVAVNADGTVVSFCVPASVEVVVATALSVGVAGIVGGTDEALAPLCPVAPVKITVLLASRTLLHA